MVGGAPFEEEKAEERHRKEQTDAEGRVGAHPAVAAMDRAEAATDKAAAWTKLTLALTPTRTGRVQVGEPSGAEAAARRKYVGDTGKTGSVTYGDNWKCEIFCLCPPRKSHVTLTDARVIASEAP